ncbi:hypothetical protein HPB50_023481 [Hyalomma asiaticum]|uniref:Uncharacterized protein n=1 Tax=Hyalomma asiaticum TaxID=266040 RepID=A0ACB7SDQ8_HYAAI|nr:hypothetical protein HPB50_023481 [Hyalomma asiaticum]
MQKHTGSSVAVLYIGLLKSFSTTTECAQAEAVKAKAEYGRKEAAMRLEKARIKAELEVLQHEKEAAAADVQASVVKAAVEQDGGECAPAPASRPNTAATVVQSRSQSLEQAEATSCHTDLRDYRQLSAYAPAPNSSSPQLADILNSCAAKILSLQD